MKGSFSEESLQKFAELAAQSRYVEFSEGGIHDFTRCIRPDGSAYGTKGKCRKGTEEAKAAAPKKEKKPAKPAKPGKPVSDAVSKDLTKLKEKIAAKTGAKKAEAKEDPKETYAKLMKQQQELVQKGDIAGAMKLKEKIAAAAAKTQESPEAKAQSAKQKEEGDKKKREEEDFDAAQKKREEGQLATSLSPKNKEAIFDYTQQSLDGDVRSYENVNGCLRFPPSCNETKETKKYVGEFDAALAKLPKNEDGNAFYRGVRVEPGPTEKLYKALEKAEPGLRMKDPGYGSYSAERQQAEYFTKRKKEARNILFVTRSKSITPINMYSAIKPENEAILPRGTEQTIRKVTKEGNNLIVELD